VAALTIKAIVNPLAFLEVDEPWSAISNVEVSRKHILKFLGTPGSSSAVSDLVDRYKKISVETPRLFLAPAEERLLERLIWPLRYAKGGFMLGNYLGTISLCGMVAEMVAILLFDLAKIQLNGAPLDDQKQRELFGSTFEKLGQERRVAVLAAYGMIDEPIRTALDLIRTKRRRYLHLWSADHMSLETDAVACFKAAVLVVVSALGLGVDDGKLILRRDVFDYLAQHDAGPNVLEGSDD
jgi:hypothetical protein